MCNETNVGPCSLQMGTVICAAWQLQGIVVSAHMHAMGPGLQDLSGPFQYQVELTLSCRPTQICFDLICSQGTCAFRAHGDVHQCTARGWLKVPVLWL